MVCQLVITKGIARIHKKDLEVRWSERAVGQDDGNGRQHERRRVRVPERRAGRRWPRPRPGRVPGADAQDALAHGLPRLPAARRPAGRPAREPRRERAHPQDDPAGRLRSGEDVPAGAVRHGPLPAGQLLRHRRHRLHGDAPGRFGCWQDLPSRALPGRSLPVRKLHLHRRHRLPEQSGDSGPNAGEAADLGYGGSGALQECHPCLLPRRTRLAVALRRHQQVKFRQYSRVAGRDTRVRAGRRCHHATWQQGGLRRRARGAQGGRRAAGAGVQRGLHGDVGQDGPQRGAGVHGGRQRAEVPTDRRAVWARWRSFQRSRIRARTGAAGVVSSLRHLRASLQLAAGAPAPSLAACCGRPSLLRGARLLLALQETTPPTIVAIAGPTSPF